MSARILAIIVKTILNTVFVLRTAIPQILTARGRETWILTLSITLAMEELSVCSDWTRYGVYT